MVLSSREILSIGPSISNQVGVVSQVKHSEYKEEKKICIPKSNIKYHKIRKNEKYKVIGDIPEYYVSDIKVPKTNIDNLIKMNSKFLLVKFNLPEDKKEYFLDNCYIIDSISSSVRYKGEGRKAIKALVEKTMSEKDTNGRIIVDVKIIDGQTSASGFFYKLGFRFLDAQKNEVMENWICGEKTILSPKIVGMMYLPKEAINKLLMYKMLL